MLQELQDSLIARLTGHPYFAGPIAIPVLEERLSDVQTRINNTLALGGAGIAVVVKEPTMKPGDIQFTRIAEFEIQVIENPTINGGQTGSKKAAKEVAYAIDRLLTYDDTQSPAYFYEPGNGWSHLQFQSLTPDNIGEPMIYKLTFQSHRIL